jgi:hypothetical protein
VDTTETNTAGYQQKSPFSSDESTSFSRCVTDADHQRQHAAGPTGGSRAACHLSDAIFTHPLLAEGLNTLFAMFDAEGGALSRR